MKKNFEFLEQKKLKSLKELINESIHGEPDIEIIADEEFYEPEPKIVAKPTLRSKSNIGIRKDISISSNSSKSAFALKEGLMNKS